MSMPEDTSSTSQQKEKTSGALVLLELAMPSRFLHADWRPQRR